MITIQVKNEEFKFVYHNRDNKKADGSDDPGNFDNAHYATFKRFTVIEDWV